MNSENGEFFEKHGELYGEWRISDFLSFTEDVDKMYSSPTFFFSDACWNWRIYSNGQTASESEKWISLYLRRLDSGPQKSIQFTVGMRKADGGEKILWNSSTQTFDRRKNNGWGQKQFLLKSYLLKRKSELAPSGVVTITCTLRSQLQNSSEGSLFRRLWNLSLSLKNILCSGKRYDVVLKLKNCKIPAHKMILESRSAVFNRMFSANMRESQTGEVNVEDADMGAFKVALSYAYGGEPNGLSVENVYDVYKVAHKYDFQELRKLCTDIMQDNVSMGNVCDVIAFANLYDEKQLRESANDYFAKNKSEIFKTENWKRFKRDHPETGFEVLESVLEGNS